jgi:hypothetical protein
MVHFIRIILKTWLILLFSVTLGVISFRGHKAKLNVLHLDKCKLPCWNGVIPGKTTVREAYRIILDAYSSEEYKAVLEDGFIRIFETSTNTQIIRVVMSVPKLKFTDDDLIDLIQLEFDPDFELRIGDLFVVLDRPQYAVLWGMGGGVFPSLVYEKSSVVATMVQPVIEPLLFCANENEVVDILYIFSQPPSDDYWRRYELQTLHHYSACFRWIERYD